MKVRVCRFADKIFDRDCIAFILHPSSFILIFVGLLRIIIALTLLVLIPFFLWGGQLMSMLDATAARLWIQNYGAWGWLAVILLLISDLFLPIPATGVMSAAGYVYGPWYGGIISFTGSFACGMLAYVLCRSFGRPAAVW